MDAGVDLDDVLFAHLGAHHVFDDGHRAVEPFKAQQVVKAHALPGGDVVDDNAVLDGVDVHSLPASFKSLRMSAMRMYLP